MIVFSVRVYIKPEYKEKQFQPEDFLPVQISKVSDYSSLYGEYRRYTLTLATPGMKELAHALVHLYDSEFVAWADLDYSAIGVAQK